MIGCDGDIMNRLCFYIFIINLGLFYVFNCLKGFVMSKACFYIFLVCLSLFYIFYFMTVLNTWSPSYPLPVNESIKSNSFRSKMFKEIHPKRYKEFKFSGEICSNIKSYKRTKYDKICSLDNKE